MNTMARLHQTEKSNWFSTTCWVFYISMSLVSISIIMVFSSSGVIAMRYSLPVSYFLLKQLVWVALGICAMTVLYCFDYQHLQKISTPLLIFSFALLILAFVPGIGIKVKGAYRWIGKGPIRFQPSELAKLSLIIYMATMLSKRKESLEKFSKGLLPTLLILGAFLALIVTEPDLGATVVTGLIVFVIWFVAGVRIRHLFLLVVAGFPCVGALIWMEPYRLVRLLSFVNPSNFTHTAAYQHLRQSLISVGSGGMFGLGLGKGLQKYLYLPEAHSDFIFAIICEELGFIGACGIILLYGVLIWQGIRVALKTPDFFGSLVATGIIAMIAIESMINMGVVLGCLPPKGLALPLLSYGGSSMLVTMSAIGILLNISKNKERA